MLAAGPQRPVALSTPAQKQKHYQRQQKSQFFHNPSSSQDVSEIISIKVEESQSI